jgi:hypothetical protein
VGEGINTIAYSSDGITWSPVVSSPFTPIASSQGHAVAWGDGKFVAGGNGTNQVAYSSDGISWTASTSGNSVFTTECRGMSFTGNYWVGVGSGTNTLGYSVDGITWVGSGASIFTVEGFAVAWNAGLGSASGSNVVLNQNGDGLTSVLEIVAPEYYNIGYNNCAITIT